MSNLKLSLRHCPKCGRVTLQALVDVVKYHLDDSDIVEKDLQYCTHCGTFWHKETREEEKEFTPPYPWANEK